MVELPDDPCDDWSFMPVPHQRSLEPLVFWDETGLDTLWLPRADRDGKPVAKRSSLVTRLLNKGDRP